MLIFEVNQIFEISIGDKTVYERILFVDHKVKKLYSIDINHKNALPILRDTERLEQLLVSNQLSFIDEDPFLRKVLIKNPTERSQKLRDKRWEKIKDLVIKEPNIYESDLRYSLIKEHKNKDVESNEDDKYYYKYLRLFWQGGTVKNALLPDYMNSGARGKERSYTTRTGRPNVVSAKNCIIVTEELKEKFRTIIKRHYLYKKDVSLSKAYNLVLRTYFTKDTYYDDDGNLQYIFEDQTPSFKQFYYWYNKTYTPTERTINKKTQRKYDREDRPTPNRSDEDKLGPVQSYQIDATIADVYLLSEYDAEVIIGRPVIYAVIDVYTRMIAGVYVGLEGPSWIGAMMAIQNATEDKVNYCEKHGITIRPEEWPAKHLPHYITADRGEMISEKVKGIIDRFDVKIQNTPPFRPDWKGIIERQFGTIQGYVKPFISGTIDKDYGVRGEKDYALEASLNLAEFRKVIIKTILHYNKRHWLNNYEPEIDIIQKDIPLIPNDLWRYGVSRTGGALRSQNENLVKVFLMPRLTARVTSEGIHFKRKLFYTCERAQKESWLSDASIKGSWAVEVAFDPRTVKYIYIINEDGTYEVCTLLSKNAQYEDYSWDEYEFLRNKNSRLREENKKAELESEASTDAFIQELMEEEKNRKAKGSKKRRKDGIRSNRAEEKRLNRNAEAFTVDAPSLNDDETVLEPDYLIEEKEQDQGQDHIYNLLMGKQKEGLK
ncbi:Mu transposase C-terminal domain-containing protein [Terribacillus halophilus]|uniref:Mu transposase C-terminal domain-containing protein n=1 Tax=Terribacillus halophilus TaxID=361279 RepID=UPI00098451C5|nr:Mu transposase C-terminal domain-containing protein [Terribacillus halophilus]